jgi:putative inorganic carbon (HCO3(-)) transporter
MPVRTAVPAGTPARVARSASNQIARVAAAATVLALSVTAAFALARRPLATMAAGLLVLVTILAAIRLPLAVALLAASFYFDSYLAVGPGLLTVGKLVGGLALGAWFLSWTVNRQPVVGDRLFWPLAALAAWLPVSLTAAYDRADAVTVTIRYLTFFALVFLVVQTVNGSRDRAVRMLATVVTAAAVSAAIGLGNYFLAHADRAHGPLEDPNDYAFLLAVAVPLTLFCIRATRRRSSLVLAVLALIVISAAILASFSRSALIGLLSAGVWAVATRRLPLRFGVIALAGLVVIGLVAYWLAPTVVSEGVTRKQQIAQRNIDSRLVAWRVALAEFETSPVLGVGPGNFEHRFAEFALPVEERAGPITTHNAYLHILAELGGPGLGMFLAYLVLAWSRLRRRIPDDPEGDALRSALAAGFVVAMVGSLFLTEQFYSPLWFLPAVSATLTPTRPLARPSAGPLGGDA